MLTGVEYNLNLKGMSVAQEKSTWVGFIPRLLKLGKITLIFDQSVLSHDRWVHRGPESPQLRALFHRNAPARSPGFPPLTAPPGARPAPSPSSHFRICPQNPLRPFGLPARRAQLLTVPRNPFTPTFRKRKIEKPARGGALGDAGLPDRACAEAAAGCRPGRSGERATRVEAAPLRRSRGHHPASPGLPPTARRLAGLGRPGRAGPGAGPPETGAEPGAGCWPRGALCTW